MVVVCVSLCVCVCVCVCENGGGVVVLWELIYGVRRDAVAGDFGVSC